MSNSRTIIVRRLRDGSLVEVLPDGSTKSMPPDKTDWAAFDALTEADVIAAIQADPDSRQIKPENERKYKIVPRAKSLRRALHLTQEEFSARYHIPLGTLRDWEQGKSEPDQAARAYLYVIASNPEMVRKAFERPRPSEAAE